MSEEIFIKLVVEYYATHNHVPDDDTMRQMVRLAFAAAGVYSSEMDFGDED